eukprot:CAMPEP_0197294672 /NCGR_PEP_ID=MMETSP0890-20130614/33253_1 /TAXON_ID=44058 ORGANISM="Aureoumbra lagunensis, Strain CCMP1510" /NCGR_SAMPLE_ID=MMETSP0890 /ASSEMBLY_ACC=CAM_ASM_000533 /LENGTH=330 /DNA_ID=CAMNT_0042770229 /DNA_START=37 /DNA_END=1026 /DNA_ORIENTATION=-
MDKCLRERVIVGTSAFGGLYDSISYDQVYATVARAVEKGLKKFDTAPHYGLGVSEQRLGAALSQCKAEMSISQVAVYTKVGRLIHRRADSNDNDRIETENLPENSLFVDCPKENCAILDYRKSGVTQSLYDSVARLGLTSIKELGGVRVHDPEIADRYETEAFPEAFITLRQFNSFEVSIGTNSVRVARRALDEGLVDAIMLANSWNLLDQGGKDLLLSCHHKHIPVDLAGIYASGLLAGGNTFNYQPATESLVSKRDRWKSLADKYAISLPAVALAFAFLPPAVRFIAIGLRSPDQVDTTIDLLETQVPLLLPNSGHLSSCIWRDAIGL